MAMFDRNANGRVNRVVNRDDFDVIRGNDADEIGDGAEKSMSLARLHRAVTDAFSRQPRSVREQLRHAAA
jgi:hypothetical protein